MSEMKVTEAKVVSSRRKKSTGLILSVAFMLSRLRCQALLDVRLAFMLSRRYAAFLLIIMVFGGLRA